MSDQQIIDLFKSGGENKAVSKLYQHYRVIEKAIKSKGGNTDDAKDMFQETLVVFCRNVQSSDFQLTASIQTYLFSIAKNLWNNHLRKKGSKNIRLEFELETEDEAMQEALEKENRFKLAEQAVSSLGEKCKKLLSLFYLEAMRMKEIAKMLGYSSENVAKNQKYKCLEQARKNLQIIQTK